MALSHADTVVDYEFFNLKNISRLISNSDSLNAACDLIAKSLVRQNLKLQGVTFCDLGNGHAPITAYRDHSTPVRKLATELRKKGGCPIIQEAKKRVYCFDILSIDRRGYRDFLNSRFLDELARSGHREIHVVPILLGNGLAVFSVGTLDRHLDETARSFLINAICQMAVAVIGRFPEVTKLFAPRKLNTIEAEMLLFCSNGYSNSEVAEIFSLTETTVYLVFDSASRKLGARNQAHAVSRAVAIGEISNLQLGGGL